MRDGVIEFTAEWSERTEIPAARFISWLGLQRGKFYAWKERYGKANEHNGRIPRDHWLTPDEKQAILDFHESHPLDGYRRLTFMIIDHDVVAASPTTVHRVLRAAGRLDRWTRRPSKKGTGFEQPLQAHQHWHAIRPKAPSTAEEARHVVTAFVHHYNTERLHSAIDYVTPADRLAGRHTAITAERDRRLEAARERRAQWRQAA